jgi:hypothetical protein
VAIQEDHIREAGPLEREFSDSGTRALGTGDDVGLESRYGQFIGVVKDLSEGHMDGAGYVVLSRWSACSR